MTARALRSSTAVATTARSILMKSTGSALQHLEAGVARPDVVERELEAERAQPRRLGDQEVLAGVGALGDLEHDLLGLVARAAHGQHQAVARQRVMLERLRRDVEEQQRAGGQLARDAQRGAAAARVELMAAPDRVGDLERLAGAGGARSSLAATAPGRRARACR